MFLSLPHLPSDPRRIVSLVPSQTELLWHLGLEAETVGITSFCIHPPGWLRTKTKVGGTKSIKADLIRQLNPDLIIANKEENVKEQIEELANDYPVWVTDVNNLDACLNMISDIGRLTGKEKKADSLAEGIRKNFAELQTTDPEISIKGHKPRTAYLIWRKPYMTVGGDTFIHDMISRCGFENVFSERKRYPEISVAELQAANPQLLLLSSEPYPFKQQHIDELSSVLPGCRIMLADGEFFSWYGSRLFDAPGYFKKLINACS